MRSGLLGCWGMLLVVLAGCDGVLEDYSGTRCNANGRCIEGYHCVRESWRCELGPVDSNVCAITTCFNADGCCPQGCNANSDTDCPSVCGNRELEPGEQCDDGNETHEDDCPNTCKPNICGDGAIDRQEPRVEACDDGNTVTEQECAYGTRTCTPCNSTCTASLNLTGRYCGDGFQNGPGEQCDDGNPSNEDDCLDTCARATCGDGFINLVSGEACDDGNTVDETACPYGTKSCTTCKSACTGTWSLTGPYCGDNVVSNGEVCDDGNNVTETSCPYGTASCTLCNDTCSATLSLAGPTCGDRVVNGPEACDDGNTSACGTCNDSCSAVHLSRATGRITLNLATTGNDLKDLETFTLNDGINQPVSFEFDKNGVVVSGRPAMFINNSMNASQLAQVIADAINGAPMPLEITAVASSNMVDLVHNVPGTFGNQSNSETIVSSRFSLSNMTGGSGVDCPTGTGCTRSEDCALGLVCLSSGTCGVP